MYKYVNRENNDPERLSTRGGLSFLFVLVQLTCDMSYLNWGGPGNDRYLKMAVDILEPKQKLYYHEFIA